MLIHILALLCLANVFHDSSLEVSVWKTCLLDKKCKSSIIPFRCRGEEEACVYSESGHCCPSHHLLSSGSPQVQHSRLPHGGRRCRLRKPSLRLPWDELWGNSKGVVCICNTVKLCLSFKVRPLKYLCFMADWKKVKPYTELLSFTELDRATVNAQMRF